MWRREGNAGDRRTYSLRITPTGKEMLAEIAKISREHNESVFAALTLKERDALTGLLQRVADQQGLTRGVHPGGLQPTPRRDDTHRRDWRD